MSRARVLLVDDKENMLKLLTKVLEGDFDLVTASDGARALSHIASEEFDLVVTDLKMPGADGLAVLRAVKERHPDTEVILMTAYATVSDAVAAMKLGAYDYLQKPFEPDAVALICARALERKRLRAQAANLREELTERHSFSSLIGKSHEMQEVYRLLTRAANLDITVLLLGETGTGKELAARAIHYQGTRRSGRFVPVNCGALPAELIESELFGHARGAFTGAGGAKHGLFEEADRGTLFLDEVAELPTAMQVKLNRALQEREIRRVGENVPIHIDVRIVAATHRDLRAEVAAGRFREDLYYRLHVLPIRLPALRERRDDIPILATHFVEKYARAFQRPAMTLTPAALRILTEQKWPGNVRELENAIERAVAVASGNELDARDLPAELVAAEPLRYDDLRKLTYRAVLESARDHVMRDYLVALMRDLKGSVTQAAERAGIERPSLHRLLKRYGVRSADYKAPP